MCNGSVRSVPRGMGERARKKHTWGKVNTSSQSRLPLLQVPSRNHLEKPTTSKEYRQAAFGTHASGPRLLTCGEAPPVILDMRRTALATGRRLHSAHLSTRRPQPSHLDRVPPLSSSLFSRTPKRALYSTPNTNADSPRFPCVERNQERERSLDGGPEPAYENVVSGYKTFHYPHPFTFVHGGSLPSFNIAYETWGTLNESKSNAILLHTGLSASSHAKSHARNTNDGWWEKFIGPGLAIDTDKFFVICTNVLGGCYGTTGPHSVDPSRPGQERYGTRFPIITIWDMVRAQFKLLDALGIRKLHASVGASMGGMQSLAVAALRPDRVGRVVSISAAARSHPYSIALRHTQRSVLMSDPNWKQGFYYDSVPPHVGMKLARQIATISYRSGPEWEQRFGTKRAKPDEPPALCADFLIETYLDHQGERFCLQYDPNSLLYISKAMDMFDMSLLPTLLTPDECLAAPSSPSPVPSSSTTSPSPLTRALTRLQMPTLVLGVQSDILFPHWQQKEIAACLKDAGNAHVTYYELDALYGHDTFLIDVNGIGGAVKGHLELA
ncbi:Alpha/Beta hydrolase protein [Fimicolochytrium jonesii]|uniref:Alpha/Beta hydrolase protein n=1 Tax=Fimicolochytrium jonesii TaxID=1396493 RepID=UPI0022FEEF3C|nr:Alpha/Beta hydrolase protein [Fimicolochytrium jonesii]KAI8823360.1 Alpha/Beta hydrolase protein [Fimicolochytrium jonesii]